MAKSKTKRTSTVESQPSLPLVSAPTQTTKVSKNIVVIADLHIGCQLGLCHPDGARLDNGGKYNPSEVQGKTWEIWTNYWKWVHKIVKNEDFDVVVNGDVIDGRHHDSTHQWSHNLEDQAEHAYKILLPIRKQAKRMWIVRGTPSHGGESGVDEERLAKRLACEQSKAGQYARNDLWLDLEGDLIHFAHHIGTTSSSAHETSALNAEIAALFTGSGRWGMTPPTMIVRSHRHLSSEIRLPSSRTYTIAFVTAPWQLPTPFAFKTMGGRTATPQIGGSIIRKGDQDLYTRHFVHPIDRVLG